jgi:hypothetical protein
MTRLKTKVERDFKKTVRDLTDHRSKILDDFAKAYMVEKGVLPSQIRLVEKQEHGQVSWHFALLPQPPLHKRAWYKVKFHLRSVRIKISQSITKPCIES